VFRPCFEPSTSRRGLHLQQPGNNGERSLCYIPTAKIFPATYATRRFISVKIVVVWIMTPCSLVDGFTEVSKCMRCIHIYCFEPLINIFQNTRRHRNERVKSHVHCHVLKSPRLGCILSQMNPVHILPCYMRKIIASNILPSASKWSVSFMFFLPKICICLHSNACYMARPFNFRSDSLDGRSYYVRMGDNIKMDTRAC
jgi:hypothetical protein